MKESLLRLKREFVRYISHEIRSPLNVCHAGMEILKAELEIAGVSDSMKDLLEDIFAASNTAIEILNDMLQYEHIDSGSFKLEMTVTPLLKVFSRRLEVYKLMAEKKHISLKIEDFVHATDYYFPCQENSLCAVQRLDDDDSDGSGLHCVLFIDKFRVDQILRNLVSNAIKFTPEGGNVTMRFRRISSADCPLPLPMFEQQPIAEVGDPSIAKHVCEYLRIEIVDDGAGWHFILSCT